MAQEQHQQLQSIKRNLREHCSDFWCSSGQPLRCLRQWNSCEYRVIIRNPCPMTLSIPVLQLIMNKNSSFSQLNATARKERYLVNFRLTILSHVCCIPVHADVTRSLSITQSLSRKVSWSTGLRGKNGI